MMLGNVASFRSYGGKQGVYVHALRATSSKMTFSVFAPPKKDDQKFPVVWYLSGLTFSHANVTAKGEFRRACAALGLIPVAPDTSSRGDDVPDDPDGSYDFGHAAGNHVDATDAPYAKYYRMYDYVTEELPSVIAQQFPVDIARQSIMGRSMGEHGALTKGLRHPDHYRAISALAPIVAPMQCPWGGKAFSRFLGPDRTNWRAHDAVAFIEGGATPHDLLVDQGLDDKFLKAQLRPELLADVCKSKDINLTFREHEHYDHSYYFTSTFTGGHLAWHEARLHTPGSTAALAECATEDAGP